MNYNLNFNIFWFRRDLRLQDNNGLYNALISGIQVIPVFIFDQNILNQLENKADARVEFIFKEILALNKQLEKFNTSIQLFFGKPIQVFKKLTTTYSISAVYTNEDYEPYAIQRDLQVKQWLAKKNILFHAFTDHVIYKPGTIIKDDGKPYTIYTPFMKKWRAAWNDHTIPGYQSENHLHLLAKLKQTEIRNLSDIGFYHVERTFPPKMIPLKTITTYSVTRNIPVLDKGTSHLGIHLRFGTLSIRKLVRAAKNHESYLNELVWREFFIQILYFFPQVSTESFKSKYDNIKWQNEESHFKAWCDGMTGYPMVDAGMRELNATGYMHNRVRMITASFLCKHLLIDWRWGEAYFAQKLLDYELASNNGNWQWAAGTGCDAAPYFRIFNPETQMKKFDPDLSYIKKWIQEWGTEGYPRPIVDHKIAREKALKVYKSGLDRG
ncbi:MAG: deoxyribodipyrimidine photo-lyase [Saprospiraceae bacterium]